jgi:ketosteroid isomerase-like protein
VSVDRVELVGRLFVAYQSGDMANVAELVTPDVRFEPLSTELKRGPVYEGVAGIAEWARELAASSQEFQPAIESIDAVGDRVLAVGAIQVATEGGLVGPSETAWVFEFDDEDRLRRMSAYDNVEEARADALAGEAEDDAG